MIENLSDLYPYLDQLPQESQAELLKKIEVLLAQLERKARAQGVQWPEFPQPTQEQLEERKRERQEKVKSFFGAWKDMPGADTFLEDLVELCADLTVQVSLAILIQ